MSTAWSWALRWVLGSAQEEREKEAHTKFTETMSSRADPPMSPAELEARLDAIVANVEEEAETLITVYPPPVEEEQDEGRDTEQPRRLTKGRPEESGEGGERRSGTG